MSPTADQPVILVLDPIAESAMATMAEHARVIGPGASGGADRSRAAALVVRTTPVTAADMDRSPGLRVIGKHGVGVDAIDCAAAAARGVRVVNTPGTNVNAVVELTIGLALALARDIVSADRALRAGAGGARRGGIELAGRTAGVIGLGRIGVAVARRLDALGMRVLGYGQNRRVVDAPLTEVDELDALLAAADLVTLHVPLTDATRGLLDARRLERVKPGAMLVNVARGGVVDETALAAALAAGRLRGAASDVFAREPPPPDHPLLAFPNFIATPHLGAETIEALEATGDAVARGVLAVLAGSEPAFAVV